MLVELIIAAVILAFSGYMFYDSTKIPENSLAAIGPEYWPQIILGGMIILALLLTVYIVLKRDQYDLKEEVLLPNKQNFWITIVATLIYTFILPYLGFPISTLIFISFMLWNLKIRTWQKLSIYSLSFTLAIVLLFPKLMGVPLPRGTGIFRAVSLFFY